METNPKAVSGGVRGLRQRREALGLSRQALATRAGCSIAAVAGFEGGYSPVRSSVLPRLWAALGEPSDVEPQNDDERPGSRPYASKQEGSHDARQDAA